MAEVVEGQVKAITPTIFVGVGGTGYEVLTRVRRLIEETYGSLDKFPIVAFLAIDTERAIDSQEGIKISKPSAAGSHFVDDEKYWAKVGESEATEIINNKSNYPWIDKWLPPELPTNVLISEDGAGQIRACGRFAFFCNYKNIRDKFSNALKRIKSHNTYMSDEYGASVTNSVNVFVVGSLSGGTGSGMIIDISYCIRHWLSGEDSSVTGIVPMPDAFKGVNAGPRVLRNGYAALIELSYFSDIRTIYSEKFSHLENDKVESKKAPFDFMYLVGTKNDRKEFNDLDEIREMIAQYIFLDLSSDFASHKKLMRDNIMKSAIPIQDKSGRGYPKIFMSFGLSSIEIPIVLVRSSLAYRMARDFISWWLNESVQLTPQIFELTQNDSLKAMRLTESELLSDLASAGDRSYEAEIAMWISGIRNEIAQENLLECTQQGANFLGTEKGKILRFVNYFQEKVSDYRANNLRDQSPDERMHGAFLQKMYDNRNNIVHIGRITLEEEFYRILEDRTRGPKFADAYLIAARQVFNNAKEKFKRDSEKTWEPQIKKYQQDHDKALNDISTQKSQFGMSKQEKMGEYAEISLKGIQSSFVAIIRLKSRALGIEVINRLEDRLNELEGRLIRFNQKLIQLRDYFKLESDRQANQAEVLTLNGINLFNRQDLNTLYNDIIQKYAGSSGGSKSTYEIGMEQLFKTLSENSLEVASKLWKENRKADEVMRLFDISKLADIQTNALREIIFGRAIGKIISAPESTMFKQELVAHTLLYKQCENNDKTVEKRVKEAYEKSIPLILLDRATLQANTILPESQETMAIAGGKETRALAAQNISKMAKVFVKGREPITPLGKIEQHRIVFLQEIGNFSLQCISGFKGFLRSDYLEWKGEVIKAARDRLRGVDNVTDPIPVHLQKQPPFWDIFPEDQNIFKLVIQAKALNILRFEENKKTKEYVVRYTSQTNHEPENIDIASDWGEVVAILEIPACREDKEEIERQLETLLDASETREQKQELFNQLQNYKMMRRQELKKDGGEDSPAYVKERLIIDDFININKLKITPQSTVSTTVTLLSEVKEKIEMPVEVTTVPSIAIPTAEPKEDPFIKLQQLERLFKMGVISQEEFESESRKVLGL